MLKNDQIWESTWIRNCSQLSGESLELCEEALSGSRNIFLNYVESDLNLEIDNCYFEEKENLTNYMTKRCKTSVNFVYE